LTATNKLIKEILGEAKYGRKEPWGKKRKNGKRKRNLRKTRKKSGRGLAPTA